MTRVLPYYALKQRRQELGFEGPDIEVKKRQDIIERSKVYTKADIEQVSDANYLVPSKSDLSKLYEVDLENYTCTCLDYPLISYCKHLCAVQELFEEPRGPVDGPRGSPHVPSLSSPPAGAQAIDITDPSSVPRPRTLTLVAEKLERLAARLRRPRKKDINLPSSLPELEAALDAMLLDTDNGSVLPSSQYLQPNASSAWAKTKKSMMPGIKTKRKPAGDPAYGAGASSGGKAKKMSKYVSSLFGLATTLIRIFLQADSVRFKSPGDSTPAARLPAARLPAGSKPYYPAVHVPSVYPLHLCERVLPRANRAHLDIPNNTLLP